MRHHWIIALLAAAASLAACGDATTAPGTGTSVLTQLRIEAVTVTDPVAVQEEWVQLAVRVSNRRTGNAIQDASVYWSATSPAVELVGTADDRAVKFALATKTNAHGDAFVSVRYREVGKATVNASLNDPGSPDVTFTVTTTALTPQPPVGAPYFPPLGRPGKIYNGGPEIYGANMITRYVLYDDGRFSLQFSNYTALIFEYGGTYSLSDSMYTFAFDEPDWQALATVQGDKLIVTYNDDASLSDFNNGVYTRQAAP